MPFDLQPTLTGELLELRPLRSEDFPALFAVASDPLIWEQHPEPDRYTRPAFEKFFFQAVKDHALADGRIDAEGAAWLRQLLPADGRVDDRQRKLLHELRGEAGQVSPAFETLFAQCMKQPQEQHTSG